MMISDVYIFIVNYHTSSTNYERFFTFPVKHKESTAVFVAVRGQRRCAEELTSETSAARLSAQTS